MLKKLVLSLHKTHVLNTYWLPAVREHYPLWFNSLLNPTPPEARFERELISCQKDMEQKLRRTITEQEVLKVMAHLLQKMPFDTLSHPYNQVFSKAQEFGLLSLTLEPQDGEPVDGHAHRMEELRRLGGNEAVRTYRNIMGE